MGGLFPTRSAGAAPPTLADVRISERAADVFAVACVLAGIAVVWAVGAAEALSASVACAALAVTAVRRSRPLLLVAGFGVAGVSLAITAVCLPSAGNQVLVWGAERVPTLIEIMALLGLIVVVVRWASLRRAVAVGGAVGVAMAAIVLRLLVPASFLAAVGACAIWALAAALAATMGGHLRRQDARREQAVAATRRTERLQLARDLHDFVAHDISEMIAQAQAGQVIARQDARQAAALFAHVERAGQQAMISMDRTVHMLHDVDDEGARGAFPGLARLPELIQRFAASGQIETELHLDPDLTDTAPAEVTTTIYRTVVEALTNVRRHAPHATHVSVTVQRSAESSVVVAVSNNRASDTPASQCGKRSGGLGLIGLAQRVETLGGTLSAGPEGDTWRIMASLPLARQRGSR